MRRKIFNSDKSRVRFNFDFEQAYWRLRSASGFDRYCSGSIDHNGLVTYSFNLINIGILPVCTV